MHCPLPRGSLCLVHSGSKDLTVLVSGIQWVKGSHCFVGMLFLGTPLGWVKVTGPV